jgi:hypothetical protein
MDLEELLRPLRPEHLGVLAIGCLTADAPARPSAVRKLLLSSFGVEVTIDQLAGVIARVQSCRPQLLGGFCYGEAVLQPSSVAYESLLSLHYVPVHWPSKCVIDQGTLVRVKTVPTTCFTLAFGMCKGEVVVLRCVTCGAAYAGPWCWPEGCASSKFPEGHHHPKGVTNLDLLESSRWFFATPQVCFETSLLRLCLLLAARGGVSWTAFYTVYYTLFSSTMARSQYAHRTHFITALEVAASSLF